MVIERDPATRRSTRIETQPDDSQQAIELLAQMLRDEASFASATADDQAAQPAGAIPSASSLPTSMSLQSAAVAARWLGDRIDDCLAHLERGDKHSSTIACTNAPSLRVFREVISDKRRMLSTGDTAGTRDVQLRQITPDRMEGFIADFLRFASRQGKRPATADAKDMLALKDTQARDVDGQSCIADTQSCTFHCNVNWP